MARTTPLWVTLFLAFGFAPEVSGATLRSTARRGGDDGDDGGMGGLGGALASMMGGGGGGGGDEGGDDDPNMIGGKKSSSKKGGGFDVGGLENSLKTGGVGGLMGMLTAMRAAHSAADTHIKKGPHGEDMYDFRDLDDGFTTPAPIEVTAPPKPTLNPKFNVPAVAIPSAPSVSIDPITGKLKGMLPSEPVAAANPATGATKSHGLVVWGSRNPPQQQSPSPPQQQFLSPPQQQAMQPPQPMAVVQPLQPSIPSVPVAQVAVGSVTSASSMYQGLEMLRQNLDTLMTQAAVAQAGNSGNVAAKLDQLTQSFTADEHKMEKRLDEQSQEMKTLEQENLAMKKQLEEQSQEMEAMGKGHLKSQEKSKTETLDHVAKEKKGQDMHKANPATQPTAPMPQQQKAAAAQQLPAKPVKLMSGTGKSEATASQASKTKATVYATEPWDATFHVHLDAKDGGKEESFTVRVHPEWAPEGAKRFQDIVEAGILKDARFFRVVPNFMVQFGIPGDPTIAEKWMKKRIPDDPVKKHNFRGMMTFATSGKNTRTTQMFINYNNNKFLDQQGFAPFAEVIDNGMDVVDRIQSKYREKPNQGKIQHHGNKYLQKHFPELSFVGGVDSSLDNAASLIQPSGVTAPPKAADQETGPVQQPSPPTKQEQQQPTQAAQVQKPSESLAQTEDGDAAAHKVKRQHHEEEVIRDDDDTTEEEDDGSDD